MIAVEIPAALAADPQVVPVDRPENEDIRHAPRTCDAGDYEQPVVVLRRMFPGWMAVCEEHALRLPSLVGQRVALAWRETCLSARMTSSGNYGDPVIERQIGGERMVVGWTAEVAEVLPIVARRWPQDVDRDCITVHAADDPGHPRLLLWRVGRRVADDITALWPLADWSPGRSALVLRDVLRIADTDFVLLAPNRFGDSAWTLPCRQFDGFAELDKVLSSGGTSP